MSEFIRPEMKARFWRWRETLVGVGVAAAGIWLGTTTIGLISFIGSGLVVIGALLIFTGVQRSRFRIGNGGAGIVQVDERQVTYFGPLDGGAVSIDALVRVELHPAPAPASTHNWVLYEIGGKPLHIPTDAEQAEYLFDVFGVLAGFETQRMLAALNERPSQPVVIWQKEHPKLH